MSREALSSFVHALEHSAALRRQLHACSDDAEIVSLARSLDFAVNRADLIEDKQASTLESWFSRSALGIRPPGCTN
ncbi:Nif11-like leader peptide family natural product precursor [Synechococcus sp. UW179A]|uniref:Nif11-like leader peptide family natural product precursor n=1 Tax=Synechococcus sp. UW179A TaxID=2575510 RepID=UPI000E0F09D9|nr:Nif11-like leader peptide family natural product precursor [Synechococcus sp. UW179A]